MVKKKKKVLEVVTKCDGCGKKLSRTCARTEGSMACAEGCGIFTKRYTNVMIKFFCSKECKLAD